MKKVILLASLLCIVTMLNAQTRLIDEFFDKYSEKDGYSTVIISSKLLGLFTPKDENREGNDVIRRLTSIRILSVEDSILNQKVNFYKELSARMDFSDYDELMVVKEGQSVTKFLVKQKGDRISELLVIAGGPGDNTLISIKGDLDLKSLSELSKDTGMDELKELDKINKNPPK
jgi:hypothetical protein